MGAALTLVDETCICCDEAQEVNVVHVARYAAHDGNYRALLPQSPMTLPTPVSYNSPMKAASPKPKVSWGNTSVANNKHEPIRSALSPQRSALSPHRGARHIEAALHSEREDFHIASEPKELVEAPFESWEGILDLLESGSIALVRGSWLQANARVGRAMPSRQEIPDAAAAAAAAAAFWRPDDLRSAPRRPHVIAVSYAWLSEGHADPEGRHFRYLSDLLSSYSDHINRAEGECQLAVYLDWCSMYQEPRSSDQQRSYEAALSSIDVLFSHHSTQVWQLPTVLPGQEPYSNRAWPFAHNALASLSGKSKVILNLEGVDPANVSWNQIWLERRICNPPQPPDEVATTLKDKWSPRAQDQALLESMYRKAYESFVANVVRYDCSNSGWADKECGALCRTLPQCQNLRVLDLQGNQLGQPAATVLIKLLPSLDKLEELDVSNNRIPENSVSELEESWNRLNKPSRSLYLRPQRSVSRPDMRLNDVMEGLPSVPGGEHIRGDPPSVSGGGEEVRGDTPSQSPPPGPVVDTYIEEPHLTLMPGEPR